MATALNCVLCQPSELQRLVRSEPAIAAQWQTLPRKRFAPGDCLQAAGQPCTRSWLIEQGLVRCFYLAEQGTERNRSFHTEGAWVGGSMPPLATVSPYSVEALEPTQAVELSYATTNKLAHGAMKNAAGSFVQPSLKTIQAAGASADWANSKDFYLVVTNAPGAEAWPITATNFIIMSKKPKNPVNAKEAIKFFRWVYTSGDASAQQLGYVPLPADLVKRIEAYWAAEFKY